MRVDDLRDSTIETWLVSHACEIDHQSSSMCTGSAQGCSTGMMLRDGVGEEAEGGPGTGMGMYTYG